MNCEWCQREVQKLYLFHEMTYTVKICETCYEETVGLPPVDGLSDVDPYEED